MNEEQKALIKATTPILRSSGEDLTNYFYARMFCSYSYFADYLSKEKGLSAQHISYMLLLFGVMGVISNFLAGRLLGRHMFWTTLFFLAGNIYASICISIYRQLVAQHIYRGWILGYHVRTMLPNRCRPYGISSL